VEISTHCSIVQGNSSPCTLIGVPCDSAATQQKSTPPTHAIGDLLAGIAFDKQAVAATLSELAAYASQISCSVASLSAAGYFFSGQ
jgi:hypothetical protein